MSPASVHVPDDTIQEVEVGVHSIILLSVVNLPDETIDELNAAVSGDTQ